ncbi:MAG: DUF5655 domain-containing protein [Chromatiales bacterium]|nr:DUF5655 domain-containing protein [Chromatiales bacterium]
MLDELFSVIERLQARIKKHEPYFHEGGKPEARARTALIDPVLSVLEWNVTDPALVEIEPNTKTKSGNYGADYALLDDKGDRVLFLEAKKLADKKPAMEQAIAYTIVENRHSRINVRYCGWTNGDVWEIYDIDNTKEPVVLQLALSGDSAAKCALKFLSLWRRSMRDGIFVPVRSFALAESEVVRAESSRNELAGGGRVRPGDPELRRGKDNKPTIITPPARDGAIQDIYQALRDLLRALGDDAQEKPTKYYVGFWRRSEKFVTVVKNKRQINVYLRVDPSTIDLESGFARRAPRNRSSRRPGVQVTIRSHEDLQRAEPLLKKSYDAAG